jgi:hypothetical protein
MNSDGEWGDHVTLYAAAQIFQVNIAIISSQFEDSIILVDDRFPTIVIGHIFESHYVSSDRASNES